MAAEAFQYYRSDVDITLGLGVGLATKYQASNAIIAMTGIHRLCISSWDKRGDLFNPLYALLSATAIHGVTPHGNRWLDRIAG